MSKTDIQKNRNKTVVISGSTSGLGKEMSIEFAKRGWVVAGFGKTKSKVDEMTKIMGVKHQIKECDVSCNKSVKLFSENGYSNVRLQQIADYSNCAYSLVYYYFKSKSDLFIATVAYSVEQTISHYKQLSEKYDCPIDLIGRWFEVNIVDSENLKFFVKIMMEY